MLIAVQRDAFTNDEGAIVDRLCYRQDLKVTIGQVAKQIEIVHLPFNEKEGVLSVVARRGSSHDHAGGIEILLSGDVGRAGRATERSQVCEFVA